MKAALVVKASLAIAGTFAGAALLASLTGVFAGPLPLKMVADVPLSGNATRFDYESLDPQSGMLYIAHMGDGAVVAFDIKRRKVIATIPGVPLVRGVLAVSQLHRVFAASEGGHDVAVIDMRSNRIVARIPAGDVDGLAYDPVGKRVFVSDESGQRDVVIDAVKNRVIGAVQLGGEAGNTVYDAQSGHILVAVQTTNELVEIDPAREKVIGRFALPGSSHSHGVALDEKAHFAYIAGELNASVVAFDLRRKRVTSHASVGIGIDVLSVDPALSRLYAASESGIVSAFDMSSGNLHKLGQGVLGNNAHVVAADPKTHLVYFPLRDVRGEPMLRIMTPRK
ncbi:MAG: hypothetical protein ABR584_01245 [Candidatus Baltobacteraceae bacterium]